MSIENVFLRILLGKMKQNTNIHIKITSISSSWEVKLQLYSSFSLRWSNKAKVYSFEIPKRSQYLLHIHTVLQQSNIYTQRSCMGSFCKPLKCICSFSMFYWENINEFINEYVYIKIEYNGTGFVKIHKSDFTLLKICKIYREWYTDMKFSGIIKEWCKVL